MASTINASTSPAAIIQSADGTADLNLQSNGSTVLALTSSGVNVTGTFNVNGSPISVAGGATQTTTGSNITLTSASNRVQEITPTANITVTLPDATTLSKGTPTFTISNVGITTFNITINSNDGTSIASVSAGTSITVALVSNSTSAGQWEFNGIPILTTQGAYAQFDSNDVLASNSVNPNGYTIGRVWNMALSSTSVLTVYRRTGNTYLYAVAGTVSGSTITYGTPVLINSNTGYAAFMAVGLSSTTALVLAQATTAVLAYGLTISGNTITVSTVSSSLNVNATYVVAISKLNSTQCLICYFNVGQTNYIWNTFTHNGASAPTVGTASAATTDAYTNVVAMGQIPLTATTTLVIYESSTYFILARVITTSGASAPTLGTSLITTVDGTGNYNTVNIIPYSATEVAILNGWGVTSFTISGTTVTFQANNTNLTGSASLYMSPIGWGSTTVGLGNYYGTLNKYIYTAGGALTKSSLGTTGLSGITFGSANLSYSNVVPLSSTQYYTVGYSTSGTTTNTGYGVVLTLI